MKNKLLIALLALPLATIAAEDDYKKENMEILNSLGLPLPDSGIKLVPRSTFGLSEEELKIGSDEAQEMQSKGYIEKYNPYAMELIYFKQHSKNEIKLHAKDERIYSTNIRSSLSTLKLGFNFHSIPNAIGFVPQGGLHKEGWSGAAEFFNAKDIGTCVYSEMNVAISHTAIRVALEDADYTINNKLTLYEVRGDKSGGYVYKARWFDDKTFHELECANMNYSSELSNAVLQLAKSIDK